MKSKLIQAALRLSIVLVSLAPATALADSAVRYANRSGQVLHVYFAVVHHGAGIQCSDLVYGGTLDPGSSWLHFVPSEHWTWLRFREDTNGAGCASDSRYEVRYSGSSYGYQADNIW